MSEPHCRNLGNREQAQCELLWAAALTVQIFGRRLPATATYVVALGAALLLLVITVLAALWQTNQGVELNQDVRQSLAQRSSLRLLLRGMQDAEAGQRGYLLTGDEAYLEPYLAGRADIQRELSNLERFPGGNAARVAETHRLEQLVGAKMEELEVTIEQRRTGRGNLALQRVRDGRGKVVMDEFRAIIAAAEAREQTAVIESMAAVDRSARNLRFVVIIAGMLLFGVGALLVVAVRNAMYDLRISRDEARTAHERVLQELGAREQAEAKVRQMQKMEAIGQLAGGVAHDFNNLLTVMIGGLNMLLKRLEDPQSRQIAEHMLDAARRGDKLTKQLLAFSRGRRLELAPVDLHALVRGMEDLLRRSIEPGVTLDYALSPDARWAMSDANQLELAILNLAINARDAMPDGGRVEISVCPARSDPGSIELAVSDNGIGMPREVAERAAEPFFTTKPAGKGTGLGLAQVYGAVRQSGGSFEIDSAPDHGTVIRLILPRTEPPATPPRAEEADARPLNSIPATAGRRILVVDDEPGVRTFMAATLREAGYDAREAEDVGVALARLESDPPELLLTDFSMPGMSGLELAERARARTPELKVLIVSGYADAAALDKSAARPALLRKPFDEHALVEAVEAALGK